MSSRSTTARWSPSSRRATGSEAFAAIDRLTSAGATSLGQGIFASLSAIAGKPLSLPENASADDVADIDIGYYGSAAIVLLSDGENTSGPDAEAVAQLASTAGVHIFPIGIGSTEGTVLQIDGFSVATALDEQIAEADRLGHQRHVLQRARTRRRWRRSTGASTCGP